MIGERIRSIKDHLPDDVCLIAVSKTKPISSIKEAYEAGHRDFGENKAQEILEKQPNLPADIHWHFIGHLQTNKVKQIIDKTHLIHSVDRSNLFEEIENQASRIQRQVQVLLQFHIAEEETKHGFNYQEALSFLVSESYKNDKFVKVVGVMGMATFTENQNQIKQEFDHLKTIFQNIKSQFFADDDAFRVISMGMSGDYKIALSCGSNMIRIGSAIFGER